MRPVSKNGLGLSIALLAFAFLVDRLHKFVQVSGDCIAIGQSVCVDSFGTAMSDSMLGWRGGEVVEVIPGFFTYFMAWNTGISYGLLSSLPVWAVGALMAVAVVALAVWWWRSDAPLLRAGLALCIGGALSNGLDRLLYGAVADFYSIQWFPFIFNTADVMITAGVLLLVLDVLGIGRPKAPSTGP